MTLRTDRPREVARFWCDLLAYEVAPNHSESIMLVSPNGRTLLIQPAATRPSQGAFHLDLRPDNQTACVERAIGLGASRADVGQTGLESWVVMSDPGGNLFCILQSRTDQQALLERDPGRPTAVD